MRGDNTPLTTSTPQNSPVTATRQSDGWIFATGENQAGPFTPEEINELGFDNRVAEQLQTTMAEVFKATFSIRGSDERPRLKLRDIDASKISREFYVDGQIVGESDKKAVPKTAHVYCATCRADETITVTPEQQAALVTEGTGGFQKKLSGALQDPRSEDERKKHPCHHASAVILDEPQFADYRLLKLRSPPSTGDELDPTDLRSVKTYALGHLIPQSKMVRVRARVLVESKTKDIVLVASDTQPLDDEISSFKLTEKDKIDFSNYYSQEGLLQNIDGYFIPRLVGQSLRKQLMYLVLHSPPWIRLPDGTRIRGLLRLLIVGDTKTFKSKSLLWIFDTLRVGEPCFAETSSRTGLLYNIDTDNRMLIWGILPRNDLGLCLIAGFHHIRPEEMEQFREVLEFLRLKVSRVVEGEANCRTRVIADSNPRRASMKEYVLPCEAIADLPFFSGTPDMTRWDLYFTVKLGDVDQKSIDEAIESPLVIPPEVQRRHVLWAMSRRVDNVRFADGTLDRVNQINGQIVDKYGSEALPIVHPGFKGGPSTADHKSRCDAPQRRRDA